MQTIERDIRISSAPWQDSAERTGKLPENRYKRKKEKSHSRVQDPGNDFLKEQFNDISLIDNDPLFSEKNYAYLYDSARNYAGLLENEFTEAYEPKEFRKLYTALDSIIPQGQVLSLSEREGLLYFSVSEPSYSNMLFYIPCEIVDKTEGKFREILLEFFRILKFTQGLQAQKDSYHCDGLFQEIEMYEDEGIEVRHEHLDLLKSYNDGAIGKTLSLINEHPEYAPNELRSILAKYEPASDREEKVLKLIDEGLELMEPEIPILRYAKAFDLDPDGYIPMGAEELIMIVYADDWMVGQMIESVNVSCSECEPELFCVGDLDLTPQTDCLMRKDGFVESFISWVLKLCNELYEYVDN